MVVRLLNCHFYSNKDNDLSFNEYETSESSEKINLSFLGNLLT
jgi:hypothetical protein